MIFSLRSALVSLSTARFATFFTNAQSSNVVIYTRISSFSHDFYTGFIIHQTHSKFVSLGNTKPIRQSEGFGATDNIEQVSGEYGRMKSILVHIDLNAGIFITPAQSRCCRYIIKSWKPFWSLWHEGSSQHTSLLFGGVLKNVDFTCWKSVRFVISNLAGHSAGSEISFEYLQISESAFCA